MGKTKGLRQTPEDIERRDRLRAMGRPKYWNKPKIEDVARDLDEWSLREDSDYLGSFCVQYDVLPEYLSEFSKIDEIFSQTLKIVKHRIADRIRRKLNNGKYNYGLFMREAGMYDSFLNSHDREEKVFEAEIKAKAASDHGVPVQTVVVSYANAPQKPKKPKGKPRGISKIALEAKKEIKDE